MSNRRCLPRGHSLEATIAPARIAEATGEAVYWRERDDGRIEIATIESGAAQFEIVEEDGRRARVESHPAPAMRQPLERLAIACWLATWPVVLVIHLVWLFVVLLALTGLAIGLLLLLEFGISHRPLRRRSRRGWRSPTLLDRWEPASVAQLLAVEQLADKSRGVARVRVVDTWHAHVVVPGTLRRPSYVVDAAGGVHPTAREASASRPRGAFGWAFFPLILLSTLTVVKLGVSTGWAALVPLALVGLWVLIVKMRKPRNAKPNAETWHEVRTVDESGGD